MKRAAVTALLLTFALCLCVFTPLMSAQSKAHVQTGPKEYAEDHHDASMSLMDMIEYYPQASARLVPWVREEMPLPPRNYPAHVIDPVLQRDSMLGPLAASIGLDFEGNDFDTVCN